jgi:hypothetical protein
VSPDGETETHVEDWRARDVAVDVDDSQLVDWQADNQQAAASSSSAITGDDDFSDLGSRKR